MEKKYTPGPWTVKTYLCEEYWIEEEHYNIGPCLGVRNIANAHLISSAPDLLESGEPFSKVAGELFANNYNESEIVATFAFSNGITINLTAGDFFAVRRAQAKAYGQDNKGE